MTRIVLMVMGCVLILMGVVWTLQGLGVVGGSAMSGQTLWAVLGPVVVVAGGVLLFRGRRCSRRARPLTAQANLRRYAAMASAYATTRMPRHQARATQRSAPTGCSAQQLADGVDDRGHRLVVAKARTGPGIVRVSTKAELMNGRKMSG